MISNIIYLFNSNILSKLNILLNKQEMLKKPKLSESYSNLKIPYWVKVYCFSLII